METNQNELFGNQEITPDTPTENKTEKVATETLTNEIAESIVTINEVPISDTPVVPEVKPIIIEEPKPSVAETISKTYGHSAKALVKMEYSELVKVATEVGVPVKEGMKANDIGSQILRREREIGYLYPPN